MTLVLRDARVEDVPAIAALLADDVLGARREAPGDPVYAAAFAAMQAQGGNREIVAEEAGP